MNKHIIRSNPFTQIQRVQFDTIFNCIPMVLIAMVNNMNLVFEYVTESERNVPSSCTRLISKSIQCKYEKNNNNNSNHKQFVICEDF